MVQTLCFHRRSIASRQLQVLATPLESSNALNV